MHDPICQSCGMPLTKAEEFGTEKDGTQSQEYCVYCYKDGHFIPEGQTLEEMIESCVPFMVRDGMAADKARELLQQQLPTLKRWRQ
ncbi:MAG TPA: zinc ribbon domain-containing protein [Symbiobacteriaceae bacterium]|nr:zinc ribbon domain-containing protein [Symbiobacteriaceae bacterium]